MTKIVAHLCEQLIPSENQVYCSTMQLAWNELSEYVGGEITFDTNNRGTKTALTLRELNKKSFRKEHLDEESYLAVAGLVSDGILSRIQKGLQGKFRDTTKIDFSRVCPTDIIAYAYLLKNLMFLQKFDEIEDLSFSGMSCGCTVPVKAFGTVVRKDSPHKLLNQVRVLHYNDPTEFTLSFKTQSEDIMIMAMLKPESTLEETLAAVNIGAPEHLIEKDKLKIPKLSFDLEHRFSELQNRQVLINGIVSDRFIAEAIQLIKFELNEFGAKLRSEAAITMRKMAAFIPAKPREFIYDKPFLIYLKHHEDAPPYFVAWVGDTDFMVRK
jgi:hypothetical protein